MKNKKILRMSAIVLSIIILLINIVLYITIKGDMSELLGTDDTYKNAGILIVVLFKFGSLVWGIGAILIVWMEYFLILLANKVYNKFTGLKRIIIFLLIAIMIAILLINLIKIVYFVSKLLFISKI